MVRLGFVGVGNMGQAAHLRNYAALPECKVVAIAEPRWELARRVAEKYDVPAVYRDAQTMIEQESLDGIVASQPFERHCGLVSPLYRAGLPILTEKPLASTIESGEKMLEALQAGGSWHMVGYMKRNDPASVWARNEINRLIASGDAGAMRYVRITMPPGDWIAGGFDDLIRSSEAVPPSSADTRPSDMTEQQFREYVAFVNYYIHQVNLLRFLLGTPYSPTFADKAGRLLVAETESGVTGVIEMAPFETSHSWQESALVTFERGYVRVTLPPPLAVNRAGTASSFLDSGGVACEVSPSLPNEHAMKRQARNFVEAIQGKAQPACEAAEALEDLKVAAAYLRLKWGPG
jgi:predicted dehydrogenase